MSNTVITNYTDLNGPSTKADSSVVVIVNKDGSLSVDQNLLGTLMGKYILTSYLDSTLHVTNLYRYLYYETKMINVEAVPNTPKHRHFFQ